MLMTVLILSCLLMQTSVQYPQNGDSGHQSKIGAEKSGYFTIKLSKQLMDVIGVKQGMAIGEAGVGHGDFAFKLSERVGNRGKIYANEIQEKYLELIKERCKKEGVRNIETILGEVENPLFPKGKLDMVIMIHVFHDLEKPVKFMVNVRSALKPGAFVVILDYRRLLPKDIALGKLKQAGYELVRIETFIPYDYIYIFRPKH